MKAIIDRDPEMVKEHMYSYLGQTIKNQQFSSSEQRFMKYLKNAQPNKVLVQNSNSTTLLKSIKVSLSSSFSSVERRISNKAKEQLPALGYYNPNYRLVQPTSKVYGFGSPLKSLKKKSTHKCLLKTAQSNSFSSGNLFRTAVNFKVQLGRDKASKSGGKDAHEERFAYLSKPCTILGNYHRSSSPDFSKMRPHKGDSMLIKNMTVVYYKPVQPSHLSSLRAGSVSFAKSLARSSIMDLQFSGPGYYSIDQLNKGYNLLGHVKKVPTPNLTKMLSRKLKIGTREVGAPKTPVRSSLKNSSGFKAFSKQHAKSVNRL